MSSRPPPTRDGRAARSPSPPAAGHPSADGAQPARARWLLLALGWIFFALGALGAVLPVLPTTPFMLLALWAFSRSSPRFHHWLRHHRVFGPPLERWDRDHVVPIWARVVAFASMAASLAWVTFVRKAPWYGVAAMAALMIVGVWYVARFPTRPPPRADDVRDDARAE